MQAEELLGAGRTVGARVECLDRVDSTNNYLKQRATQGAPHGLVVTAEEQTGGRGRMGRSFSSPRGKGLYLSALLRPPTAPVQALELTAWTAVAVCRALEGLTGLRPAVKWMNDVQLEEKKLCGILAELGTAGERLDYVVLGIGINVAQTPADFPPEVAPLATSLAMHLATPPSRAALARALIGELDRMVAAFPAQKAEYLAAYRARCTTPGRPVEVRSPAGARRGFALGLDEDFRLLVDFGRGAEAVESGEVSVRGIG